MTRTAQAPSWSRRGCLCGAAGGGRPAHSLNFHSWRHMGQCCCTCCAFSHLRMQCMWKQCEHWPHTRGQSSPGTLPARGQGRARGSERVTAGQSARATSQGARRRAGGQGLRGDASGVLWLILPLGHPKRRPAATSSGLVHSPAQTPCSSAAGPETPGLRRRRVQAAAQKAHICAGTVPPS